MTPFKAISGLNLIPMAILNRLYFILTLGILISGCCTAHHREPVVELDPVSEFKSKHHDQAKLFDYMLPVRMDTYVIWVGGRIAKLSGVLTGMKERFGNTPGLTEFADRLRAENIKERDFFVEYCTALEEKASGGGAICQYRWSDGKTTETGFLVVKSGEIVWRESLITDYPSHKEKE